MTADAGIDALRVLGHELRRPLTVIRGAATMLADDSDRLPAATREHMLAMIDRSAAAMADLIDDLLTAVHLDVGDIEYLVEPVDLAAVLDEAVESARALEPQRPIHVRCPAGLTIEGDREQALRAVRAVLVNAVQHTPEGSPVDVAAEVVSGAGVRLEVRDRGRGIPPAVRDRAFQKFTRLQDGAGGAGLGLFLARGLARGMAGDVTVTDREDGGAVVCFTFRHGG